MDAVGIMLVIVVLLVAPCLMLSKEMPPELVELMDAAMARLDADLAEDAAAYDRADARYHRLYMALGATYGVSQLERVHAKAEVAYFAGSRSAGIFLRAVEVYVARVVDASVRGDMSARGQYQDCLRKIRDGLVKQHGYTVSWVDGFMGAEALRLFFLMDTDTRNRVLLMSGALRHL